MHGINWKAKKYNLICYILLIPYFEPLLFKESKYSVIDKFYTILKLTGFIFIVLLFFKYNYKQNRIRLSQCSATILILETIVLFSTIIYKGDIIKYIGPTVSVLSLTLLAEVFLRRVKFDFLRIARNVLFCLMIINVVLQIIHPEGIITGAELGADVGAGIHFLGIDNRLIFFYLPLLFFSGLYDLYTNKKITALTYAIIAITLWSTLSLWAVGGFLGILLISVSLIIGYKLPFIKKISMRQLVILDILVNIFIVFFRLQKYFEYFIVVLLHKDLTLSGRTYLWDWAIESFFKYPIFGFGIQSNETLLKLYRWVAHPHNMFLNYLTTSGIVGFLLFVVMLFITAKNVKRIPNKSAVSFCNFTVFTILFLSIADTLDAAAFYMIYVVINVLALNEITIKKGNKT